MKNAIATVEIFALREGGKARRLSLVISTPERSEEEAGPWSCRVAFADLHRARTVHAPDSVLALSRALALARGWLADLESTGIVLSRDRAGSEPFVLD